MGEELDTPIKEYQPKDNENKFLKYGLNRVQGWKKSMEDFTLDFAEKEPEKLQNIFGIFDGHGGTEVPKYLSENFFQFLKNNENFKIGKYKEALTETFFELDKSFTTKETQKLLSKYSEELKENEKKNEKNFINNLCNEKLNDDELDQIMAFNEVFDPRNIENANIAEFTGSTGIIIFISDNRNIFIANAGNSRCLLVNGEGKIFNKTKDHTMNDEEEKKRVALARSFNEEEEKKKGEEKDHVEYLDSTRGFGDWEFKGNEWIDQKDQEISVEPEILEVPINDTEYLIVGSHGMFENGNSSEDNINNDVCKFLIGGIKDNPDKSYSKIIEEYFEKIIAENKNGDKGLDNMSCIVIKLNKEELDKFLKQKEIEDEEKRKKEEEEKKMKKAEEERKKKEEKERKKAEEKTKKEEEEKKKKAEEEKKKTEEEKKEEEPKKEEDPKKEEENKNEIKEENKNVINEENKNEIKEEVKAEEPKEEEKKEDKKEENPQNEEKKE